MSDIEAQTQVPGAVRNLSHKESRRKLRHPSWQLHGVNSVDTKPPKYGDTSATYWKLYASESEANDKNLVQSLMSNTSSMVLLNSLFSSIVASFIIEIYKILLPVNGQQTTSGPSSIAIRINIVLFLSFFLSIMSALSCALIQQWCSEYLKYAHPRAAPHDRGRVRTFLFQGLRIFQMRRFMYGTHVLLHISVFLFFWALSDFFYTVEHHFGLVARYALVVSGMVYILFSILPLIFSSCPFNTPMTPPLRAGCIIFLIIVRSPLWCLQWYRRQDLDLTGLPYYKGIHFDRTLLYSIKAEERAARLEFDAMEWLFTDDDFSDEDMDKFLEGLPGYMSSRHTKKDRLDQYLTAEHILSRIKEHFITCVTSVELSDDASCDRVSSCVKALLRIFQYSHEYKEASKPDELDEELLSQRTYIQTLMDEFQRLCDMPDQMIALRASCIRALAVQGLLSQLVPPDTRTTDRPRFPVSLIPIYTYFFPNDNTDTIQLLDGNHMSSAAEIEGMWKNLLHDGPIANLTKLGQAVLKKERALPSSLPFCWKALDTLLPQIRTIHSEELPRAQIHFDILHEDTRTYVHTDERGFRIRPLLDRLDTISRGRRLLMLFSSHPTYRNMVDAFEDEDLRNGDLLEAFAHCLPVFISNSSTEVCRDFMEKVIRHDDLWDSLQANLWNAQWSDSPTPDKLRVFEDCCTVLDLAFSVLGDLQDVDWRAHEFGSLLQHFESFITHCFQGSSMERTTSFRVGIIKARFCKILLAQLSNELDREGTVSIRSQWDVASLARLIYTLGLWGKEDAEFWDSYVNGGHIGPDFTTKALEMIDITARDGPLLIFCQLGHLTATAVPLDQSGPERMDIEKLWELQKKLIEDKRLPLDRASDTVWKRLGQLREQVNKLTGKITGKDRVFLQRLLRMIDGVSNSRFSRPEGPTQSEPAEEKGPETSVAVNSTPYSGGSRASFASESTAVTGRLSSGSQTSEGEDSFGQRSVDRVLYREKKTYVRPESPRSFESGSHGAPSRRPMVPGAPGVGMMDRSIGTSPSAISPALPYSPYIGDARQRLVNTSMRQSGLGFDATRSSLESRASTGALSMLRRNAPTVLPKPVVGSPSGSFKLSDEDEAQPPPRLPPSRKSKSSTSPLSRP